jgi:hypothetical protein
MASKMPPEEPSDPAREGTCAAWLAELVLTGQLKDCSVGIGTTHENGWVVTHAMAQDVQPYVDMIVTRGGTIHTERKVRLNAMIEGTPDAFAVIDKTGTLHVDDLKYGFGLVEPYENTQIAIYAGAIIRLLMARSVIVRKVVIGVFQPRSWHPAGPYRTWVVDPVNLMKFVHWIEARGVDAQSDNPVATPGHQCRHCPAASTCKVAGDALYQFHDTMSAALQKHMTTGELAKELTFLDMVEDVLAGRKSAIEAEAEGRIKRGEDIPGWHMEERRGNSKFRFPRETIRALTGIDPVVERPMTPAELTERKVNKAVVASLCSRPALKPTLKPIPKGYFVNLFPKLER